MKKSVRVLMFVLVLLLSMSMLIACGNKDVEKEEPAPSADEPATEEPLDLTKETEPDPTEAQDTPENDGNKPVVYIGTKSYTEQRTMGCLLEQLIEAQTDYEAEVINFGGSALLLEALTSGQVQVCADYTGTFYTVYLKAEEERGMHLRNPQEVYDYCVEAVKEEYDFDILCKIGFANNYAFCLRREDAEALGVKTVSDLVEPAKDMRITGSMEWFDRPDAFAAAKEVYGIEFKEGGPMDSGLMYTAIDKKEVDCISAFTTDGRIAKFDLVLVEDDKSALMPFDCCAMITTEFAKENPEVAEALKMLEDTLTTEDMQKYNHMVDEEGLDNDEVATIMLQDIGLN